MTEETKPINPRVKKGGVISKKGRIVREASLANLLPQPTKYHDGMPARLMELYPIYKTREKVCVQLGIAYTTYGLWIKERPEFKAAHEICFTQQKSNFIDYMMDNFENKNLNTALVIFFAKSYYKLIEAKEPEEGDEVDRERERTVKNVVEIMESLKKVHDKPY